MDQHRITVLRRSFIGMPSRRDLLHGLAGVGMGLRGLWPQEPAAAKRKRNQKTRNKKAKPNAFGCLSVGKTCKNAKPCCSGICMGKQGKRTCRAHDTGTCQQDVPAICQSGSPLTTTCNNRPDCACFRTTAGSSICGETLCGRAGCSDCAACQRDADCVALGFPPEAACAPVSTGICVGNCDSGMACVVPCGDEPPPPDEP
jgi:hypothetical protein